MGIGILSMIISSGMAQLNQIALKENNLINVQRRIATASTKVEQQIGRLGREDDLVSSACIESAVGAAAGAAAAAGVFVPGFNLNNAFCRNFGASLRGAQMASEFLPKEATFGDLLEALSDPTRHNGLADLAEALQDPNQANALRGDGYTTGPGTANLLVSLMNAGNPAARTAALGNIAKDNNALLYMGEYLRNFGVDVAQNNASVYRLKPEARTAAESVISTATALTALGAKPAAGAPELPAWTTAETNLRNAATAFLETPPAAAAALDPAALKTQAEAILNAAGGFSAAAPAGLKTSLFETITASAGPGAAAAPAGTTRDSELLRRANLILGMASRLQPGAGGAPQGIGLTNPLPIMQNSVASHQRRIIATRQYRNYSNGFNPGSPIAHRQGINQRALEESRNHIFTPDNAAKTGRRNAFEQLSDAFMMPVAEARKFIEDIKETIADKSTEVDTEMTLLRTQKEMVKTQTQMAQQELPQRIQMVMGGRG